MKRDNRIIYALSLFLLIGAAMIASNVYGGRTSSKFTSMTIPYQGDGGIQAAKDFYGTSNTAGYMDSLDAYLAGQSGTGVAFVDVRAYASFASAITSISTTATTLLIPSAQTVSTDVTVPATMELMFTQNGSLSIDTGKTVTINGPINAGSHQIFSGSGVVSFAGEGVRDKVLPQWWGAKGDNTTSDYLAINNAIAAVKTQRGGGTLYFPNGRYLINTTINMTGISGGGSAGKGIMLRGSGLRSSSLELATNSTVGIDFTGSDNSGIMDMQIRGAVGDTAPNVGILLARDSTLDSAGKHLFSNILVIGEFDDAGIFNYSSESNIYDNLQMVIEGGTALAGITIADTNIYSVSSPYQTIASTRVVTSNHHFYGPNIQHNNGQANITGLYLQGKIEDLHIYGGFINAAAGTLSSDIKLYSDDGTNHIRNISIEGVRMEAGSQDYNIYFTGGDATSKFEQIYVANNNMFASSYNVYQDTSVAYIWYSEFNNNRMGTGNGIKLNKVSHTSFDITDNNLAIDTDADNNYIRLRETGTFTAVGTDTTNILIDKDGNLKILGYLGIGGVIPGTGSGLRINDRVNIFQGTNSAEYTNNLYKSGSDYKYVVNGAGGLIQMDGNGDIFFHGTASGTADSIATLDNYVYYNRDGGWVFTPQTSAPSTPVEGSVAYADSTNWNPGSGEGLYVYSNGGWEKLH